MTDPYSLCFNDQDFDRLFRWLRDNPRTLFHEPSIRREICRRRAEHYGIEAEFTGDRSNMIELTVEYNKAHQRDRFLESHSARLIWPLMAIDPVYEHAAEMKVLSVGPRTVGEVLKLIAAGFAPENITAIDVVSNDPLIEVQDMHCTTFPDDTFDATVAGWVHPYSRDSRKAIAEHVRTLKSGGLLAIGLTREPPEGEDHARLVAQGSSVYLSWRDILADIGRACNVAIECFSHDPQDPTRKGAILLIARVFK